MTGFATNLGDPRVFGGNMAAGATRLGSVVTELAFRGTSPSSPSLACPEVEALAVRAAGLPDDDPGLRRDFLRAVSDCAARLRASDVEPANFNTAAAAADLEDLRVAMGVDSWWGAGSYGTQSRVLFRYLDDFPGTTRDRVAGLAVVPGDRRPHRRRRRHPLRPDRAVRRVRGR